MAMMRLVPGSAAPSFEGVDLDGAPISLEEYRGRSVLISFLRYASCPACLLHVDRLRRRRHELREAGVGVIVVFHSPPARIGRHLGAGAQEAFRVVPDPSRGLYRAWGVEASWLGLVGGFLLPSFWLSFAVALRRGHWGGAVDGEMARMPADFLVGPDLRLVAVHHGSHIGDHMALDRVLELARSCSAV